MYWTLTAIPGEDKLETLESSIGLYAVGVPMLGGSDERCLVRYDTDNRRPGPHIGPLGPHLNVSQPGKLGDRVHYVLPGLAQPHWRLADVLDFLLSDRLVQDLTGRLS
jgi:hypothetical protein